MQLFDGIAPPTGEDAHRPHSLFDGFEFPYDGITGGADGGTPSGVEGGVGPAPRFISANPAAVNYTPGTGKLGELLGLPRESGIRFGGVWVGTANWDAAGGLEPGHSGLDSLTINDLIVDFDKLVGWKGSLFGIEFLQYSGQPINQLIGAVQGFNSLDAGPPLVRQELYQLWWRQALFDDKLVIRIGKQVPTIDFTNVVRPVPTEQAASIPAVTGLIFTPVFVNPTLLRKIPGYYNSATGIATSWAPTKQFYARYGVYDGNLANGTQTGLRGPEFNGYYFHIAEIGYTWRLGPQKKPGTAAVGFWDQTGKLKAPNGGLVNGADGVYLFGSQRLWFRNPGIDNSGVSGYFQLAATNSATAIARQYFGTGLTAFGLIPHRKNDSMGAGLAWAWLNNDPNAGAFFFGDPSPGPTPFRSNELMLQTYYQMNVRPSVFFQPTMTYIPNPGGRPTIPGALAITLGVTVLF